MNPQIPVPDPIPAPAWIFHILGAALFMLHILMINVLIGGTLIALVARLRRAAGVTTLTDGLARKLPVVFALGITLGVAPLLFLQVIYGHLFYTSSILMGTFWIVIIPLIILGYYAAYVHAKSIRPMLATAAIACTACVLLYVAFMLVNNNLLMMQPAKWTEYFSGRNGTLLDFPDPTLIPRYLHFLAASVAIAGLASAWVWKIRAGRGIPASEKVVERGLYLFGVATIVQIADGLWFLFSLRRDFMMGFLGGEPVATIGIWTGFLCAIGALAAAFARQFYPTLIMIALTLVAMVFTRDALRLMYLRDVFDLSSLHVHPQYGVLLLFGLVLLIGLACVAWMMKAGFRTTPGRSAQ
ncbi:MAG: hypothetical protein WB699_13255 [Bacteroidota bacterium]